MHLKLMHSYTASPANRSQYTASPSKPGSTRMIIEHLVLQLSERVSKSAAYASITRTIMTYANVAV